MRWTVAILALTLAGLSLTGCVGSQGPTGALKPAGAASDRLPTNLTMDDAETVEADIDEIVFRWASSTTSALDEADGTGGEGAITAFDVPPAGWIEVSATVEGEDPDADLEVELVDDNQRWCRSESWPNVDGPEASCEVRPEPRPGWERWSIAVVAENAAATRPVGFEAELAITLVDGPWEQDEPSRSPEAGWPDTGEAEIRPGAKLFRGGCTIDFIFHGPDNETLYAGTAAHCVDGWGLGAPLPLAAIPGAGRLAFCSWGTMETGRLAACQLDEDPQASADQDNDLALVEIDPRLRHLVHPGLEHWGGPTGLAHTVSFGDRVLTYGNSTLRDGGEELHDPNDPREGYTCEVREWMTFIVLTGPSIPGDSGSPVLTGEGQALGVMRSLGGTACPGVVENGVSILPTMLAYLADSTEMEVELATWPLQREPALPPASLR